MIQPSKEFADATIEKFKKIVKTNYEYDKKSLDEINKKISLLKNRLNKLYMDRLDGMITDEFYMEKKQEFQNELDDFDMKHKNLMLENDAIVSMGIQIIELCKNAYSHYLRGDNENKRLLLKLLCSNFLWDGENVVITLKSTIKPMLLGANFNNGGG